MATIVPTQDPDIQERNQSAFDKRANDQLITMNEDIMHNNKEAFQTRADLHDAYDEAFALAHSKSPDYPAAYDKYKTLNDAAHAKYGYSEQSQLPDPNDRTLQLDPNRPDVQGTKENAFGAANPEDVAPMSLGADSASNTMGHASPMPEPRLQDMPGFQDPQAVHLTQISDSIQPQVQTQLQDKETLDNMNMQHFAVPDAKGQTVTTPNKVGDQTPAQSGDPLGVRVWNGVQAVGADIYHSVPGTWNAVEYGAQKGIAETYHALDSFGTWLNQYYDPLTSLGIKKDAEKALGVEGSKTPISDVVKQSGPVVNPSVPTNVTNQLEAGAAQFISMFVPTLKALKLATWTEDAFKGARFLQSVLASASAGISFAPHEESLFNLLDGSKYVPDFVQPVVHYLAANGNDSENQGRLKNALGAMGLTVVGEGFVGALSLLKGIRQMKGTTAGLPPAKVTAADFNPAVKVETVTKPEGVQKNSKEFFQAEADKNNKVIEELSAKKHSGEALSEADANKLGEAKDFVPVYEKQIAKAKTSDEIATAKAAKSEGIYVGQKGQTHEEIAATAKPKPEDIVTNGHTNQAGEFHTPEEMNAKIEAAKAEQLAAANKANALKFTGKPGEALLNKEEHQAYVNGTGSLTKLLSTFNPNAISNALHIPQIINGFSKLVSVGSKFENKPVDITEKVALASRLGTSANDFNNIHPGMLDNRAVVTSINKLIDASRDSIIKFADSIQSDLTNATSEKVLYNFVRAMNNHRAVLHWLKTGDTSMTNSIMKDFPVPTGDMSTQVNMMASKLANSGGAKSVRDLAKSIVTKVKTDGTTAAAKVFEASTKNTLWKNISGILQQWWYFNLLSGPITHVRNIVGNTSNFIYQVPARYLAAKVIKAAKDPNSVQPGEASQLVYGYMGSISDAWRIARKAYSTGELSDASSKLDKDVPNYITSDKWGWTGAPGKMVDALGYVAIAPGRALMAADEFFKVLARGAETRALALRDGVSRGLEGQALKDHIETIRANPPDTIFNEAQKFGRQLTFTEDMGKFGKWVQSGLNKGGIMAKFVVPFMRTSSNILKQGVETSVFNYTSPYSPLGLVRRAFDADMKTGGAQAQLATSKFIIGSSVAGLVAEGVLNNLVTGYGPVDPGLRETWKQTHEPYSIWMGDRWVNYQSFLPLAEGISVTASLAESFGPLSGDDWTSTMKQASLAFSRSVFSQTFIQDFSQFVEMLNDPFGPTGQHWVQRQAGAMVIPSIMAQSVKLVDPVWRDVNSIKDAVWARIPGLSTSLPPSTNRWGQPYYSNSLGPDIISPIYQMIPDGKPVNKWLEDNQVPLQMPAQTQFGGKDGHGGVKLTPWEYSHMITLANKLPDPITHKNLYDTLNDMVSGHGPYAGTWSHLTDGPYGGKASMILGMIQNMDGAARNEMRSPRSKDYEKDMSDRLKLSQQQKAYNIITGPGDVPQ